MPARINFLAAEAAAKGNAPIRLNQTLVELAGKTTAPARLSNAFAEAVAKGIAPLRVNAAFAESAAKGTAPLRLGFVAIECLVQIEVPPTVSTEKFPLAPGLSWSAHVAPKFNTRVAGHVSGREIRTAWQQYAIYEFTLTFDVLRGDATQEIQTLMGFFLARQGQYDTFLLDLGAVTQNTADSYVTQGKQGVGDGITTVFPLMRTVGYVFSFDLTEVYVASVLQDPSSYAYAFGKLPRQLTDARYGFEALLIADVIGLSGPPAWTRLDTTQWDINYNTGAILVLPYFLQTGLLEVRLRYVAGWSLANLPADIKQAVTNIVRSAIDMPFSSNMKLLKAGDATMERFSPSTLDADTKALLQPYKLVRLG